jgi:hypothetical protein
VNNNITYVKKIRLKISNRIISDLYVKEKTRSISIPSNSVYDVSQHFNVNVYGVERYTKFYPLIWKMQVISGSANISIATNGFITTNSQKAIYRVDLVISMAYKGILAISIDNFKITVI